MLGCVLALYGIVPTFPRAATILMKDTPYSVAVLLLTILVLDAVLLPQQFAEKRYKKPLAALAVFCLHHALQRPVLILGVLVFSGYALFKAAKSGRAKAVLAGWLVLPLLAGFRLSTGLKLLPGVEPAERQRDPERSLAADRALCAGFSQRGNRCGAAGH